MKTGLEIAIIGMAGRFPGARDIDELWENLKNGMEAISFFSDEELKETGIDPSLISNPNYVKAAGILADIEYFDASFFGYTPKEAEIMDPQIRVFHQCVWNALEDAGYVPDTFPGLIGLYAGATQNIGWAASAILSGKHAEIGNFAAHQLTQKDFLTLRISYKLNLMGPSFELSTACSTSLVAIHVACQAILNGECDMALAGGITIYSSQGKSGYMYQEGMIFSQDGHCRAFAARSKGIINSEGAGVVVLKRLEDAILDRDYIYAVIKGSAINNDGIRKAGFTAASVAGQAEVIKMALQMAEVEPESIGYIETHGTGTELGDPVEIEGLKLALDTNKKGFCALGSIKSNLGHTNCAAGVGGLIKIVLALKHKLIPPTLHFDIPNPHIDFINSPFFINSKALEWENERYPLRAGVSSFGIGGTNAHVVLEESPVIGHSSLVIVERKEREYQLILLSARTGSALDQVKTNLAEYLKRNPYINFVEVAYTLQVGRKAFGCRWMTVCSSIEETIRILTLPAGGETHVRHMEEEKPEPMTIEPDAGKDRLIEIGRQWLHGQEIDFRAFYPGEKPYRISLPTYPFERQRYWITSESIAGMLQKEKRIDHVQDISDWFYLPGWKRSILETHKSKVAPDPQHWLVFTNDSKLGNLLVNRLKETYRDVVVVNIGSSFSQKENHLFTLNPREYYHYENLIDKLQILDLLPDEIIHLWNITGEHENIDEYHTGRISFEKSQDPGFFSLMHITRVLGKQNFSHNIHLHVITNHVQEVLGNEPLNAGKSAIPGLLKVIPQEYAGIRCNSIDIELPQSGSLEEKCLVNLLLEEFLIGSTDIEPEIAYRHNRRWVQVFDPLHLEAPSPGQLKLRIRQKGVFLITGGLGKIGLMFAELFVKRAGARLILTGRSPFPSEKESFKIKKLKELEEMGGEVMYMQADAADPDQMRTVVNEAGKRFGAIDGIIHAAGVTEGQSMRIIRDLTIEDCQIQFQAKVWGTLVMYELFNDKPLDFCWMLSSISCVLGGLGFGAYASANRFMDALVKKHNRSHPGHCRWFSLNWDGMDAARSIDIFERIFTLTKTDQLVVSRQGNLHNRIDRWIKLDAFKETNAVKEEKLSPSHPRPNLSSNYAAPRNPTEKTIAKIWQNLLGFDAVGVRDDFLELGGDSLRAIAVISRIHQELGVNIPVTEFFNKPTIEGIVEFITARAHIEKNSFISIEPAEEKEFYELSSAQKRLYILQQMGVDNINYNLPYILSLEGKIETIRLEKTFKKLIERHESLRTSFEMIHNEPVQRVHKKLEFNIEYFDKGREHHAGLPLGEEKIINNFIRPFDLSKAPMLRVGLIHLHTSPLTGHPSQEGNVGDKYILMVDIHHIISDGISLEIFIRDFKLLYSGEHLSLLKLQYRDFSKWQNSRLNNKEIMKQEEFWLRELGGEIPMLNLPTDFPRPSVQSYEGKTIPFGFDQEETKLLKEMIRSEGVTLFIIILSIYNVLLSKICSQDEIIIGTPIVGRRHADLYNIIGFFVNTLALRSDVPGEEKFQTFLHRVKRRALDAFDNQDYQFENLVEKVETNRDMSHNPIFSVSFVLNENIWQDTNELPGNEMKGMKIKPYHYPHKTSKFDLSLRGVESEEKLYFSFEYCTKLFKEETIARFIDYFKRIMRSVIDAPGKKLSEIEITSGEDKKQILYDFNDTGVDYPKDKMIHRLFEEQAARTSDNIALHGCMIAWMHGEEGSITYKELNEKSNQLAHVLQIKGVEPDTIIGIMVERSVEMIIGILGILKSGGAYLPIDPEYPKDRIDNMLKDSAATLFLTDNDLKELSNHLISHQSPNFHLSHATSMAYIIYTSGTTGRPKGTIIEHRNVVRLLFNGKFQFDFNHRDTWTMFHSFCFDFSVWEMYGALLFGGKLIVIPKMTTRNLERYLDILKKLCVTVLNQTPSAFYNLSNIELSSKRSELSIRYVIFGGEALTLSRLRGWKSKYPATKLINMYGITETTVHVTFKEIQDSDIELNISNIGKSIPTLSTYVMDKNLKLLPIGIAGELVVGGKGVGRGYLNRPELSREKFVDNPIKSGERLYKSGDLVKLLRMGEIQYLGRIDKQVKIRGFRIELEEIENRLLNIEGIKETVVLAREEDEGDKYICAYVVCDRGYEISKLREYLSKKLPNYMIPAYFVRLEKIPLTPNGKVDRNALPRPERGTGELYIAPRDEVEMKLAEIWSEVLGIEKEKIGIENNFFELGGHSLKATIMMSKLHKEAGVKMELGWIFKNPTIREISSLIKTIRSASDPLNVMNRDEEIVEVKL
jgi:amino acid adenylation domain-containing protein